MSTWFDYVCRVAGTDVQTQIERETGIGQSNLSRWKAGGVPTPDHAGRVARSYSRPVLEAFVAAGFLTADEAGAQVVADVTLEHFSDETLMEEISSRLRERAETLAWHRQIQALDAEQRGLSDREFSNAEIHAIARDARRRMIAKGEIADPDAPSTGDDGPGGINSPSEQELAREALEVAGDELSRRNHAGEKLGVQELVEAINLGMDSVGMRRLRNSPPPNFVDPDAMIESMIWQSEARARRRAASSSADVEYEAHLDGDIEYDDEADQPQALPLRRGMPGGTAPLAEAARKTKEEPGLKKARREHDEAAERIEDDRAGMEPS